MKVSTESARVDLPLPSSLNATTVVTTCKAQSALIKQCPAYPKTPAVQSTVTDLDAAVVILDGTCGTIDQIHAQLRTLETTREGQVATVRLKHDAVETACNTASNNDPEAAKAWTGKTKSRATQVKALVSNGPPEGAALATFKRPSAAVRASCAAEVGAVGYLFQTGADPAHRRAGPPPSTATGTRSRSAACPSGRRSTRASRSCAAAPCRGRGRPSCRSR